MTNRFKYGCVCCGASIITSAAIFLGIAPHTLDMTTLVLFMLGLALMVEVDF